MSNLANYSPYNKTYRFMLLQNQAYHEKNKRTAAPCVKTNLRYVPSAAPDPQVFSPTSSPSHSQMGLSARSWRSNSKPQLATKKLVIHRNKSFERSQSFRISHQNQQLVDRLLAAQPQVVRNTKTADSFRRHMKYRSLYQRYNPDGTRREAFALGNSELLCPTLSEFNRSGLANRFIEGELSMYSSATKRKSSRMSARSQVQ